MINTGDQFTAYKQVGLGEGMKGVIESVNKRNMWLVNFGLNLRNRFPSNELSLALISIQLQTCDIL